jgi:hypothetical protein
MYGKPYRECFHQIEGHTKVDDLKGHLTNNAMQRNYDKRNVNW